jgi:pimeloyl-ACP methyl ester carboxylesterase
MNKLKNSGYFFVGSYPDKMYVEFHEPERVKHETPIVFIPGGAHTTLCYKQTPDGRKGWAGYFLEKGFKLYIADLPGVGNSGQHPNFCNLDGNTVVHLFVELIKKINKKVILFTHSISGAYGWKIAEQIPDLVSKIVAVAPRAPGNITKSSDKRFTENLNEPLVTTKEQARQVWANSKQFPADYFEEYYNSLTILSPNLLNQAVNYNDSQLKIDPEKLKDVQILIITGDSDTRHSREADEHIAKYFKKNKIQCKFMWLADKGITGNGHLMMIEKNNLEIADLIYRFIQKK